MRAPNIDEPIKLGRGFLIVYLVLIGAYFWVASPREWQLPLWVVVGNAFLYAFLGAMALYCTSLFVFALLTNFRAQLRGLAYFSMAVAGMLVAMAVTYAFPNLEKPAVYVAFIGANLMPSLLRYLFRKRE
jgi:RsiW-degrading membrane proteinase PrsW (M82 family)